MTKFQKLQKLSSIIPFWSTIFVSIVTIIELKRRKASPKIWLYFSLIFILSGSIVYLLNTVITSSQHIFLNLITSGLVLAVANILLVDLQVKCANTYCPDTAISRELKIAIYCIIVVVFFIGIAVCAYFLFTSTDSIPDNNGSENTSLSVITTNEIISTTNRYSASKTCSSQKGEHSNISGKLKDYDYDEIMFSSEKVSGILTLQATKTPHDKLTLGIDSQLEAGNMEILIIIDNEYYKSIPINESSTITLTDVANKTVVVKIATESAKMRISVKRITTDIPE